jgi:hypothetical protein
MPIRMDRRLRLALAALPLALAACRGGTGPELGGAYVGQLDSPFSVEGAAVIDLTHPDLRSVSAPGRILVARGVSERTLRIVVINPPNQINGGPVSFVVRMADGAVPPRAEVVAVSGADNRARDFVGAYEVRFTRLEQTELPPGYSPPAQPNTPPPPISFTRLMEPFFPGGRPLFAEERIFADNAGNANQMFDLGDVRGFLRFYPSATPPPVPWTR